MAKAIYDLREGKNHAQYLVLKKESGHYLIFANGVVDAVGEIRKRAHNDWYGEVTIDDMFFNCCDDSLADVMSGLETCIVRNGKPGSIYQKDAATWTANLIARLRKG